MTTKSDVYSFGILLWEMFSFGEMPFGDIEIYQLKRHILNGHTMEKPPYANDNVYVKWILYSNALIICVYETVHFLIPDMR